MSNITENETWINKLVDELVDTKNIYTDARVEIDQFDTLIELIFNNARLAYNGEGLRLENEDSIFEYLKVIAPNHYFGKIKSLKAEREAGLIELQAKAEAEKAKKEA